MGIKWNPGSVPPGNSPESCRNGGEELGGNGQLQVYIVEGAGMMDEDTHKPFKAFIKWCVD